MVWHRHECALKSKCTHALGPCQKPRLLPLFLVLKWWEQAFQNQTGVFANIFWPSCLPIFISFIFGKRKFPDRGLGIRAVLRSASSFPSSRLRLCRGSSARTDRTVVSPPLMRWSTPPREGPGGGRSGFRSCSCIIGIVVPLPEELRPGAVEAAPQVESMSRPGWVLFPCFNWIDTSHVPVLLPGPAD